MIYAVHVSDSSSGLEKIVTVEARTPEEAYHRIENTGCRVVRVTPARPGVAAGVVLDPPAPDRASRREDFEADHRRERQEARAAMIRSHNLRTLWPIVVGIGSILWGLVQWHAGNDVQAIISAVLGVVMSIVGAIWRWTQDRGPWR